MLLGRAGRKLGIVFHYRAYYVFYPFLLNRPLDRMADLEQYAVKHGRGDFVFRVYGFLPNPRFHEKHLRAAVFIGGGRFFTRRVQAIV
ncbi:hypothetical protein COU36_02195 [Candidatus Micrarchaeota archaeon CG10_big_fil_rev_8_21_14_0_10_59_7]|nr:MAG: hypothetical protein COU36_02195 [Candidatus Micrarchaeota archaeon CG10_big_fil_rev_8_21_14_0_10_59_7]